MSSLLEVSRELREKSAQSLQMSSIGQIATPVNETHPFKTLVQTVTGRGASGLDVPSSLTERVQTKLVGDLGGVHGVGQILQTSALALLVLEYRWAPGPFSVWKMGGRGI